MIISYIYSLHTLVDCHVKKKKKYKKHCQGFAYLNRCSLAEERRGGGEEISIAAAKVDFMF